MTDTLPPAGRELDALAVSATDDEYRELVEAVGGVLGHVWTIEGPDIEHCAVCGEHAGRMAARPVARDGACDVPLPRWDSRRGNGWSA